MIDTKPYRAPCVAGSKMSKFDGELLFNPTEYQHIVGALQHVTFTQPNIAYSVNQLCQHTLQKKIKLNGIGIVALFYGI